MINIGECSNNSIMHFDLYITYSNYLERNIVIHQNITIIFLCTGHEPSFVWTHMIKTTWVQYPLFRMMLLLINNQEYQIIFWRGVILNNDCNKFFLDFIGTIFLPMVRSLAVITNILWIKFSLLESFAFLPFLSFCRIGHW